MSSLAKIAANRANARKSTGPKTPAGKARAAQNGRNSKGPRTAAGKLRAASKSTGPRTAAGKRRAAQNAQKSTGPKSEAGKKRVGQNAVTHGLTRPASCEADAYYAIADFAQAITKENNRPELLPAALRIGAAQFDLLRIRRTRRRMFVGRPRDLVRRLAALEGYEARARRQRKTAIRDLENGQDSGVSDLKDKPTNQSELTKAKSDKTK